MGSVNFVERRNRLQFKDNRVFNNDVSHKIADNDAVVIHRDRNLRTGFQPGFPLRWLKAAALSYLTIVPVTLFIVPPIQRMVFHMADIDPKTFQPRSPKPAS